MAKDTRICVGAISGPQGIKGEVRLKSYTGDPEAIATYGPLETERGDRTIIIASMRPVKGGLAVRLEGIESRNAVEALGKPKLYVARDRLPETGEDEYYQADLIGLTAFDPGGAEVGKIRAVLDFGAGEMLDIFVQGAKTSLLVPFTAEEVPTVDIAVGRVVIDPKEMVGEQDQGT